MKFATRLLLKNIITKTIGFYCLVLLLYAALFGDAFIHNLTWPNMLIAPIMAFGSFVAGATFLGGGAVAFPALTKILHFDPQFAKTFSLAIQSVGMTSASVYIVCKIRKLPILFIALYSCGSALGVYISLEKLSENVPAADLRLIFSLFLLCFLSVYLFTQQIKQQNLEIKLKRGFGDGLLIVGFGITGGIISGLIGSGADVISFCLMALYFRIDIKRATQISVILMAITSIIGMVVYLLGSDSINPKVLQLWYVAAPVVVIGAPVGAYVCNKISVTKLLAFICCIVVVEVVSTIYLIPIAPSRLIIYLCGTVLAMMFFTGMVYLVKRK